MRINFKYFTKSMKRTHNNTHKTNTVTVSNFIKAVTKIRIWKNSQQYKLLIYNSIKLSKDSDKIPKSKSLNK